MEISRAAARCALLDAIKQLEEVVPTMDFEEQITLQAITPHMHSFKTTVGREVRITTTLLKLCLMNIGQLWFASLHCVHHWSMVSFSASILCLVLVEELTSRQVRVIAGEMVCRSYSRASLTLTYYIQGVNLQEDFGFAPSTLVYQGVLDPSSA